jgi:hypothetical protein
VKDREHVGSASVGSFKIPTDIVLTGNPVTGWYDLVVGTQGQVQNLFHKANLLEKLILKLIRFQGYSQTSFLVSLAVYLTFIRINLSTIAREDC